MILCTGYSSLIDREDVATIGVRAYVEKPVVVNDLLHKVREVLSGHE